MIIIDINLFLYFVGVFISLIGIIFIMFLLIDDIVSNKNSKECFMYVIRNKKYNTYYSKRLYGINHFTDYINDAYKFKTIDSCKKALKYIIKKDNFEIVHFKKEKIKRNNLEIKRVLKNEEIFKK